MEDMLLLRPPPRKLLERGPPKAILQALERFVVLEQQSVAESGQLCRDMGISLPDEEAKTVIHSRRRIPRKLSPSVIEARCRPRDTANV